MSLVLNSKGFGILKSSLTDAQTKELISALTVRPNVNPTYDFGSVEEYPIYRFNKTRYYVPKFYGLKYYNHLDLESMEINERAGIPIDDDKLLFNGTLREDQVSNIDDILKTILEKGACISNAPTGGGKTVSALYILSKLKRKTLIIVHKQFLMDQWFERINQYLPHIGHIGRIQGDLVDISGEIVLCMLQSLSMKEYPADLFDCFGFVIIDEVHHICAKTFSKALFKIASKYMLGLSATIKRLDGLEKVIHWFLGQSIVKKTVDMSLDKPLVKFIDAIYSNPIKLKYNRGPTGRMVLNIPDLITNIALDSARNDLIVKEIIKQSILGRNVLMLSERRDQCLIIKDLLERDLEFIGRGLTSGLYIGQMKQEELSISNNCSVILGTFQLVSEGFDNPRLDTVILATSKSNVIQSIGRVMRRKNVFRPLIIDIVDKQYLIGQYRARLKLYTDKEYEISEQVKEEVPPKKRVLTISMFD